MYRRCELMTLTFDLATGAQFSTCSAIYTQQRQPGQRGYQATECHWAVRDVIAIDRSATKF